MITLKEPITVIIPPITKSDGTIKHFAPVVLDSIDYIVNYDNSRKFAMAIIKDVNRPILLWEKEAYSAIGQFTDQDVDARVSEILGEDPAKTISDLFIGPDNRK
jgi:hypothetical protein